MRSLLEERKNWRLVVGILMTVLATRVDAVEAWHTSTVRQVYPLAEGAFVLTFATESASCTSASSPKYYYVAAGQNGVTADGLRNMLAVALTAFAMGRPVSIAFESATSACYINRLSINQ
jgi:hypothetical protein